MEQIFTIEFWAGLFGTFKGMGIFAPFLLAALESLIPPLPLVGIVTLNVASMGIFPGILASWAGTCTGCTLVFLLFRYPIRHLFIKNLRRGRLERMRRWVSTVSAVPLFFLLIMPFTPSAVMNFAFGISDFPVFTYLLTLYLAKAVMISLLAVFGQSFVSAFQSPVLFILSALLLLVLYRGSVFVRRKYRTHELEEEDPH